MNNEAPISLPFDLKQFDEIIDVRSPSEFEEDHLPGAINLPVLDNAQRVEVGTLYKQTPFEARKLGASITSRNIAGIIDSHFLTKNKTYSPLVYCWRGGMRSSSLATVLRMIGWRARLLDGGYKSFRKYVIKDMKRILSDGSPIRFSILEGPTGSAKTRLLEKISSLGAQVLDLESLAKHRGSVLGLEPDSKQPSQKKFETLLWEKLSNFDTHKTIFVEAESNRIGALHCPPVLWNKLRQGSVVSLSLDLEKRAHFLLEDYPHFLEDKEALKTLLEKLVKIRGRKTVTLWQDLIDQGKMFDFVKSILHEHYDLAYRRAGKDDSNYRHPSAQVELEGTSESNLLEVAKEILDKADKF